MDFAQLDVTSAANEGAVLEVRGPTGEALLQDDGAPVTITLLGMDSDMMTKASNAQVNRFLRQGQKNKTTAESALEDQLGLLAKATIDWSGIKVSGEVLECTPENVKSFYRRFRFVRDQVQDFINDLGNFVKASPQA